MVLIDISIQKAGNNLIQQTKDDTYTQKIYDEFHQSIPAGKDNATIAAYIK